MSLPGPNVRLSTIDSRHLAWPHLFRDPDPPTTTTDCPTRWSWQQWGFQRQGNRENQQLQFARHQRCQQSRPLAVGPHESTCAVPSARRTPGSDPRPNRICAYISIPLASQLGSRLKLTVSYYDTYMNRAELVLITSFSSKNKCSSPSKTPTTVPEMSSVMPMPKSPALAQSSPLSTTWIMSWLRSLILEI